MEGRLLHSELPTYTLVSSYPRPPPRPWKHPGWCLTTHLGTGAQGTRKTNGPHVCLGNECSAHSTVRGAREALPGEGSAGVSMMKNKAQMLSGSNMLRVTTKGRKRTFGLQQVTREPSPGVGPGQGHGDRRGPSRLGQPHERAHLREARRRARPSAAGWTAGHPFLMFHGDTVQVWGQRWDMASDVL